MLKRLIRLLKTSPLLVPVLALINLILFVVDIMAVITTPVRKKTDTLLILRMDVLGDYLFFRNYLRIIRRTAPYRHHQLVFGGNAALKTFAESFDDDIIDGFLWADIYKLSTRPLYRFRFVRQLRRVGASVVFCPTYSRVLVLDDFLAWASGARERVGCYTDYINIKRWEAAIGDRLYTRMIDSGPDLVFELERDRKITGGFLQEYVDAQPLTLTAERAKFVALPSTLVVFSLGAGQDIKIWPPARFAAVAEHILRYDPACRIVVTGVSHEQPLADEFLARLADADRVQDMTGRLSLSQLVYTLSNAKLLITNESGTVHLAASLGTPAIGLSQGKALVRWHPYPVSHGCTVHYVYPDFITEHADDLLAIAPMFNPESPLKMVDISVERVIAKVEEIRALTHRPMPLS